MYLYKINYFNTTDEEMKREHKETKFSSFKVSCSNEVGFCITFNTTITKIDKEVGEVLEQYKDEEITEVVINAIDKTYRDRKFQKVDEDKYTTCRALATTHKSMKAFSLKTKIPITVLIDESWRNFEETHQHMLGNFNKKGNDYA